MVQAGEAAILIQCFVESMLQADSQVNIARYYLAESERRARIRVEKYEVDWLEWAKHLRREEAQKRTNVTWVDEMTTHDLVKRKQEMAAHDLA